MSRFQSGLLDRFWLVAVGVASLIGGIVTTVAWDTDRIVKDVALGVMIGIPACMLAFELGKRNGVKSWPGAGISTVLRRRDRKFRVPLDRLIESAETEIIATGPTLGLLKIYGPQLREKAADGVKIRLLFADPTDPIMLTAVATMLGFKAELGADLRTSLQTFRSVFRESPAGNFQVGLHKRLPTCSMVIVDRRAGVMDFFLKEQGPEERLSMEIEVGDVMTQAVKHFEWLAKGARLLRSNKDFELAAQAATDIRGTD